MAGVWARGLAGAAMLAAAFCGAARADDSDGDFLKGKTVRFVVGFSPGGGFDAYARMIAPWLARRLNANVVVENQPGAGGMTALNGMVVAEPDGLRIMLVNGNAAALSQLLGISGARFDLNTLTHFGTTAASPWVWLMHQDSPVKTVEDARKFSGTLAWSATGPIDGLSDGSRITCAVIGVSCKVVMGYTGTNEAALAVTRKEMDAVYLSDTSANNYAHGQNLRAVANMSRRRSRFFPDTPTIFDQFKMTREDEAIMDYHATAEDLGRILVGPPKMPAARAAFLRKAIAEVLRDPKLIEEGERTQRYVEFIDADQTAKAMRAVTEDLSPALKARIARIVAGE